IGRGQRPEEALVLRRTDAGDVAIGLEVDDVEDEKALPALEMFDPRRQLPRALPSPVVEPVVTVGCHLQLAEPAEDTRGRRLDVDGAQQTFEWTLQIGVARI